MPEQASNRVRIQRWIVEHTPEGGRVLDIGCGEGDLLRLLVDERKVRAMGIELSEPDVMKAVQKGLTVHHGNVEEGLDHFANSYFDVVILSLTLQELGSPRRVLIECFRVGKRVVVVFPNFGYWRARYDLALLGRAPRTRSLPHTWYESPNRHFLSVLDWEEFCSQEGWRIVDRAFLSPGRFVKVLPNWRAEVAMYLLEATVPRPHSPKE